MVHTIQQTGPINYLVEDMRTNSKNGRKVVSVRHLKPYYKPYCSDEEVEVVEQSASNESFDDDFSFLLSRSKTTKGSKCSPQAHSSNRDEESEIVEDNFVSADEDENRSESSAESSEEEGIGGDVNVDGGEGNNQQDCDNSTVRRSTRTRRPPSRYGIEFPSFRALVDKMIKPKN